MRTAYKITKRTSFNPTQQFNYCRNGQGSDSLIGKAHKGLEKTNKLEPERFLFFIGFILLLFFICFLWVFLFCFSVCLGFFVFLWGLGGFFLHSTIVSLLQPVENSLHEAPRLSQRTGCLCNHYPLFTVSDKKQRKIGAQQQKHSRKNSVWPPTSRGWS